MYFIFPGPSKIDPINLIESGLLENDDISKSIIEEYHMFPSKKCLLKKWDSSY